jgi:hypothetical protein
MEKFIVSRDYGTETAEVVINRDGLAFEYTDATLPPEVENEWLDHVLEFERQFEQGKRSWVRRGTAI